jgi:uncharacterized protein (DUF1330 family)
VGARGEDYLDAARSYRSAGRPWIRAQLHHIHKEITVGNVSINESELQKFVAHSDNRPVVMINLLKFKEKTDDGEVGAQVYNRYVAKAGPLLAAVGGRLVWQGTPEQILIGGEADRWDKVLLVEYPSRKAFLDLVNNPEFQAMQADRLAALDSTVLIASTGG